MIRYRGVLVAGLLLLSAESVGAATSRGGGLHWLPCARYKRVQAQKHAVAVQAHVWHEVLLSYIDQKYLLPQILRAAKLCMQNPHVAWAVLRAENKQEIYGRYCESTGLEAIPEEAEVAFFVNYGQYFFHAHGEWEYREQNAEKVTEMAALVLACICMYYPRMIARFIKETASVAALPLTAFISAYLIFMHTNTLAMPRSDQWSLWGLM
jgi:hypothetical protein